jgi:hypothetical protein
MNIERGNNLMSDLKTHGSSTVMHIRHAFGVGYQLVEKTLRNSAGTDFFRYLKTLLFLPLPLQFLYHLTSLLSYAFSVPFKLEQEVLERTNLPTFLTLFKNVICIKTSVCPNITLLGNSVPILKHSHIQNNVSNKRIVGSS